MDALEIIKNKLILEKNITNIKSHLDKTQSEIFSLLDDNQLDLIGLEKISLKINNIRKHLMESKNNNEFTESWWVTYLKFLNDTGKKLLILLNSKNTINSTEKNIDKAVDKINFVSEYIQEFNGFIYENFDREKLHKGNTKTTINHIAKNLEKTDLKKLKKIKDFVEYQSEELRNLRIKSNDVLIRYKIFIDELTEEIQEFYKKDKIIILIEKQKKLSNEIIKKEKLEINIEEIIKPKYSELNNLLINGGTKIKELLKNWSIKDEESKTLNKVADIFDWIQNMVWEFKKDIEKVIKIRTNNNPEIRKYNDSIIRTITELTDVMDKLEQEFETNPFNFILEHDKHFTIISFINNQIWLKPLPFDKFELTEKKKKLKRLESQIRKSENN